MTPLARQPDTSLVDLSYSVPFSAACRPPSLVGIQRRFGLLVVRSLRGQWRTISCCSSRCCCRLARTRCCRRQLQDRRCSGEAGRPCTGEAPLLGHTHTLLWRALSAPTIPICLGPRLAALGTIPAERNPPWRVCAQVHRATAGCGGHAATATGGLALGRRAGQADRLARTPRGRQLHDPSDRAGHGPLLGRSHGRGARSGKPPPPAASRRLPPPPAASRRLPPPPSVQAQSSQANSNPSPNPYPN